MRFPAHLVCNPPHVDLPQMTRNLIQSPPLLDFVLLGNRVDPDDTIHIVPLPFIDKTIPPRIQSSDFFALDEVERIDGGSAVTMGAHRVDIAQKGSVKRAILQLGGRVCQ